MSKKPRPIVHDPRAEVDLSGNTVAASQRVAYKLNTAIDEVMDDLHMGGLPRDPFLVWQLAGCALHYRAQRFEVAAFGYEPMPHGPPIYADSEGLWTCELCGNVNPPNAAECLTNCRVLEKTESKEAEPEEAPSVQAVSG